MPLGFLLIPAFGAAAGQIGVDRFFLHKLVKAYPVLSKGWLKKIVPS